LTYFSIQFSREKMNDLELAPKVVFESSCANEERIEFLEWVDPEIECNPCSFDTKLGEDLSQETAFPTLRIAMADTDQFSGEYTWNPVPAPKQFPLGEFGPNFMADIPKSFGSLDSTKAPLKKARKRKTVTKRTDFNKGTRSKSETGFRGVRFSTNGCRFRATVNVNKKPFNVGTFDTAAVAAEEYDKALIKITNGRVERSRLNFPNRWASLYQQVRQDHSKNYVEESDFVAQPFKRQKLEMETLW